MIKEIGYILAVMLMSLSIEAQDIDLSHWKITIPEGKPSEVEPPEILNFESNELLKPFFYRNKEDGALVFHAYPAQTTRNTKYSRSELREQMEPGSNKVNWTFEQGGMMRGTLSVPEVTQNEVGNYHRVIIMQIHGRLTNQQRDLIGEDDNNAPPILKIYWDEGRIRVKTKVLKDVNASDEEILHEHAWGDDKGRNFQQIVGNEKFTLEVNVSKGLMTVTLNDDETFVYDGIDMERWGVFENYFKAGNYFQSRDEGSYAKVNYYELEVSHVPEDIQKKKAKPASSIRPFTSALNTAFDLTNWKLELPSGYQASDWKLSNYQNDKFVSPFVYLDPMDQSLVMKAYPSEGKSKAKYTRNNLREQVQPGTNDVNWTMKEGGVLETELQLTEISKDKSGKYHRTLLMQVDGRTDEKQTEELGLRKPNNIPFIKVYWQDERIYVTRKVLKDDSTVGDALLMKTSWTDEKGIYSREKIGFDKVKITITVKKNKVTVQINDEKPIQYRDLSVSQWYFENYFTVGNYLQSKDEKCYATVKYFKLEATHENKK
ncbi:MAG: polysaccharide lyase family 7 protein [Flavobacteriales bacterium]